MGKILDQGKAVTYSRNIPEKQIVFKSWEETLETRGPARQGLKPRSYHYSQTSSFVNHLTNMVECNLES